MRVVAVVFIMMVFCPPCFSDDPVLPKVAQSGPVVSVRPRVPKYEGKPLAYWLEQFQKAGNAVELEIASYVIREFGSDVGPAIPALVDVLYDHSPAYRYIALTTLKDLGSNAHAAAPDVAKLLKQQLALTPETRARRFNKSECSECGELIATLAAIAEAKDAASLLVEALKRLDPRERRLMFCAASSLWKLAKNELAIPVLIELLNDDDPEMIRDAAVMLSEIGPSATKALPALKVALKRKWPNRSPIITASGSLMPAGVAIGSSVPYYGPSPAPIEKVADPDSPLSQAITKAIELIESTPKK